MVKAINSIAFVCNPVHTYNKVGWSPHDDFLAGTEESIREWTWRIKQRGFDISVYYNGEPTLYNGVEYKDYSQYIPADREVNVKYLEFTHAQDQNVYYLTNETDIAEKAYIVGKYAAVILPSKWAWDHLGYNGKVKIVPHAYDKTKIKPAKKITNQCIYVSSPDRGLSELTNIWAEVVEAVPDATLIVTYDAPAVDLPNTMFIGHLNDEEMSQLYNESDFWIHPCTGGELFCMAAVKAQVARAIPIYYSTMALSETVRWGVRAYPNNLKDSIIDIMNNKVRKKQIRDKLATEHFSDWEDSTDILLNSIGAYYERDKIFG